MRRTWRWVTEDDEIISIWSGVRKPRRLPNGLWEQKNSAVWQRLAEDFRAMYGIDIPPGACVKVEFFARIVNG